MSDSIVIVTEEAERVLVTQEGPGPQGTQGPKGDVGDTGPQGVPGTPGPKGDKGDTGAQGPKGDTGDQGPQGIPGLKGDKGDTGPKGDTGAQGLRGIAGAKGDTGDQGPQGVPGIQGLKGDKGDAGPAGADGPRGADGAAGPQGIQGIQGLKGDKGDQGATGPAGADGAPGPQGIPGVKGDKGDQGVKGDTGPMPTPPVTWTAPTASTVPLIIAGAAGQTADFQQWQTSAGSTAARVTSGGAFLGTGFGETALTGSYLLTMPAGSNNGALYAMTRAASNIGLIIKGSASQTADLVQWQDSNGSKLGSISSGGSLYTGGNLSVGAAINGAKVAVAPLASFVGIIVQGAVSQTADLQQWQTSAGVRTVGVGAAGSLFVRNGADTASVFTTGATQVGGPNGVTANTVFTATDASTNRVAVAVGGGPANSLAYLGGGGTGVGIGGGIAGIYTGTPASIGLIINAAASQTANLQEWRNSAGTIIGKVTSGAGLYASQLGTWTSGNPGNVVMQDNGGSGAVIDVSGAANPNGSQVIRVATGTAANRGIAIKGAASQTANLEEWQNSAGVPQFAVTAAGLLRWVAATSAQATVGAAGTASPLPTAPSKYLKVVGDDGVTYVIPAYAAA